MHHTMADDNPANRFVRRAEFPAGARDLLKQVEKHGRVIPTANSRFMRDLQGNIDEHVFCLVNSKGASVKRLSAGQEIQLLDMLIDFFDAQPEKSAGSGQVQHYTYFDLLFCGHENQRERVLHDARMELLVKMTSLAVQLRCAPLLNDVGQWTQRALQQKPPTQHMLDIASRLVDDFCRDENEMATNSSLNLHTNLIELGREAPTVSAVLLPLCMERYDFGVTPPLPFVHVICEFIASNTRTFFRPYRGESTKGQPLTHWAKLVSTCFAKLCCLSILAPASGYFRVKNEPERRDVYSKLHLSTLQTLTTCAKLNFDNCKLFTTKNVNFCLQKIDDYRNGKNSPPQIGKADVDESLDRLTQIVQVALSTKCFQGSRKELDPGIASRFVDNEILIFVLSNQLSLS